jgi:hypothetical protein
LRLPGRLVASLLSASIGWAAGNVVTSSLILLNSPTVFWAGWAQASGYVCLAAWAVAGIPLALSGARFPAGPKRAKAILFAGLLAAAVMALFFGPGGLAGPEGRILLYIVSGQALATAGIAMLSYCLLTSRIAPMGSFSRSEPS